MSKEPAAAVPDAPATLVELVVDADDNIIAVGAGWNAAATAGGAPDLAGQAVIGRSLYDFVCGDDTRMFVRAMLAGARVRGRPTVRDYRCDTPTERRWMEMELTPQPNGAVRIVHRGVRSEPLPRPLRFAAAAREPGTALAKRCSICNRLRIDGHWHEPDSLAVAERAAATATLSVIYGVCPSCLARNRRALTPAGTPAPAGRHR